MMEPLLIINICFWALITVLLVLISISEAREARRERSTYRKKEGIKECTKVA